MGNKRGWEASLESFALIGLLMLGGVRGRLCVGKFAYVREALLEQSSRF